MKCKNCNSDRMMSVQGKSRDLHTVSIDDKSYSGYLPDDLGIGGGDYIEIDYCLNCGTIDGEWPLPETGMERGTPVETDEDENEMCDYPATGAIVVCVDDKEVFRYNDESYSDKQYFQKGKLRIIKKDEVSALKALGYYIDKSVLK